jgi:flagellar hook assembly protein FlgD
MPRSGPVRIRVLNAKGQPVRTLVEGNQGAGSFQTDWDGRMEDGSRASSGTYLCVLQTGRIRRTVKMQLIQ